MEQEYNAEILNNQLFWTDTKHIRLNRNKRYKVKVIVEKKIEKKRTGEDWIEFFRNSPLFGVEIDLSRDKDFDRDIEL